ncbi:monocarboxylate transporter 14 [Patella vulgata]|uniref:monocarboxylate transporter 14 n=1 Tax=Patella vulgata TaxID=6465 RepID=UPI0021800B30|nr:monocarboxylate transporter 14 [Patella vulgata]
MPSRKTNRIPSTNSCQSDDSCDEYIPTPPDGGYGWVIVACSFVCNVIVDGIGYSFGVFLVEFVDFFKEPKSKVSLVGSLLVGMYLFAGPIVSGMVNRYGCRPVAVIGSLVSTGAFVLCTFSPNVEILTLTYGVIGGFGFGMIYLPAIVSVGYYFETKRAMATGIAVCGSGVGTFMFAPLSKVLLDVYDWNNAIMILAGIILQAAICGMLMRPLEVTSTPKLKRPRAKNMIDRIKEQTKSKRFRSESECSNYIYSPQHTNLILERVMEAKLQREQRLEDDESELASLPSTIFVKGCGRQNSRDARIHKLSMSSDRGDISSLPESPSLPKITVQDNALPKPDSVTRLSIAADSTVEGTVTTEQSEYFTPPTSPQDISSPSSPEHDHSPVDQNPPVNSRPRNQRKSDPEIQIASVKPIKFSNGSLPNNIHHKIQECSPLLSASDPKNIMVKMQPTGGTKSIVVKDKKSTLLSQRNLNVPKEDYKRPLYKKDIFYSGSVLNIPQFRSQVDMRSYIQSITTIPTEQHNESVFWKLLPIPKSAKDTMREMLDISLLKDAGFMMLCLGNVFVFMGFYVPFVFLVDKAQLSGIEENKAAFLVSVIGITNCFGRLLSGWLADRPNVSSLLVNNVSILITGITTAAFPFCNDYITLTIAASIFGLSLGAFISLSSIIICDLLGIEKLTNAFGLMTMFRGIAAIAGPPLAGFTYDTTKSYDISFYMGGALVTVGAILHLLLHTPFFRTSEQDVFEQTITPFNDQGPQPETLTIEKVETFNAVSNNCQ